MRLVFIITLLCLLMIPVQAKDAEVWMCHKDAMALVGDEAQWDYVKNNIDVIMMFIDKVSEGYSKEDIAKLVKICKEHGIKIAIECGGTLDYVPLGDENGEISARTELTKVQKIRDGGGTIDYFVMDGPIRRLLHPGHEGAVGFTRIDEIVNQIISYMRAVREVYPNAQFYNAHNFPNWGWKGGPAYWGVGPRKQFYGDSMEVLPVLIKMTKKAGIPLKGIVVDEPYDFAIGEAAGSVLSDVKKIDWMGRVLELEKWARKQAFDFNIYFNSQRGGDTSEKLFCEDTLAYIDAYRKRGGSPDGYIIESWYKHPQKVVPETEAYTMAYVVKAAIEKIKTQIK